MACLQESYFSIDDSSLLVSDDGHYSQNTHGTSITVPGPGSLTGKAIKALGKLTVRGIDRVLIYTRVVAALSRFPHTENEGDGIKGITKIYDLVLELSKPGFYAAELRNTVLSLVGAQIQNGYTRHLIEALCRWEVVELEIFLHGLVHQSSPTLKLLLLDPPYSDSELPLQVTLEHAMVLMARISRTGRLACQMVLDAGFFELFPCLEEERLRKAELADIYRAIFQISIRPEYQQAKHGRRALRLLICPMLKADPIFAEVLALWDVWEIRMLIENVLQVAAPSWYRCLKAGDDLVGEATIEWDFVHSLVTLFDRVAQVGNTACMKIVRAGYLDMMIFLQRQDMFLRPITEEINLPLFILRDGSLGYTVPERQKAADIFIFQLARQNCYKLSLYEDVETWNATNHVSIIQVLVEKLRSIISGISHELPALERAERRRLIQSVAHFLLHLARKNPKFCGAIVHAGYLDILLLLQEQGLSLQSLDKQMNISLVVLRSDQTDYTNTERAKAFKILLFLIVTGDSFRLFDPLSTWPLKALREFQRSVIREISSAMPSIDRESIDAACTFSIQVAFLRDGLDQVFLVSGFFLLWSIPSLADNMAVKRLILNVVSRQDLYPPATAAEVKAYISDQISRGAKLHPGSCSNEEIYGKANAIDRQGYWCR
ncbi:hypothetical protein Hypma_013068 [Hypsizygus marmoreus]|uniref:Uncharacterized protein n=1 Tax=Hypsizygus marmoreus TaxID=39966 RepID=A0A369JDJ9_HYPMA|nr:hypothetical protein Hypma_013068 [Hypsizygus marmoreus]